MILERENGALDRRQWMSLCRAYVLLDYWTVFGRRSNRRSVRATLRWAARLLIAFAALGAPGAAAAWSQTDTFLAAILVATMIMSIVGIAVLTRASMIVAPDDAEILGFRPLNSRTYFAVRTTGVLIQTTELAVLCGSFPVVAFLTRAAGTWPAAAAAAAMVMGSSFAVSLLLVVLQASLLRFVRHARLGPWLTRIQALLTLVYTSMLYVSGAVVARRFAPTLARDVPGLGSSVATWAASGHVLWYPAAWFAAYVPLTDDPTNRVWLCGASLSILFLAALACVFGTSIATDYSVRVNETVRGPVTESRVFRVPSFVKGELRAVAVVAYGEWVGNAAFRMRVIAAIAVGAVGAVCVALFYPDLSGANDSTVSGMIVLQAALAVLAIRLQQALRPDATQCGAAWPFHCSPANRAALLKAGRDLTTVCGLLPSLAAVTIVLVFLIGDPVRAAASAAALGGLSWAMLQVSVLANPELPFSAPSTASAAMPRPVSEWVPLMAGMPVSGIVWSACETPLALVCVGAGSVALSLAVGRRRYALAGRRLAVGCEGRCGVG